MATLGYPLFEDKRKSKSAKDIFYCKGKDASASGEMTNDGFVVYKGSVFQGEEVASIGKGNQQRRATLVEEQKLVLKNGVLELVEDYIFSSPSAAAAAAILGSSVNGWDSWKNKAGKTLDEVKRK